MKNVRIEKNNSRLHSFLENFIFSFSSNLFSFLTSAIIALIIPRFLGVTEYGYWQLYFLYISYTNLIQMGWCDGVYLRYGGKEYEKLNKGLIGSQFWYLLFFSIIFLFTLLVPLTYFKFEFVNVHLIFFALIVSFINNPGGILYYILQATNNIKKYAKIVMIDRSFFLIVLAIFLITGNKNYHFIIISDIIGKLCAFSLAVYYCKDIVFTKITNFKESIIEALRNINAGFKLMIANIASQLILGIIRLNINNYWGIDVFGKVSLTLSISGIFMIFINAMSMIIFPLLRRISNKYLSAMYNNIRTILMIPIMFILIFFYPLKQIITLWLPQYSEGLIYMTLLFPIIIYESKMSLLVNTYLKALRKEKQMLIINIVAVALSFTISYITVYIYNDLDLTIISIVFILAFRCILADLYVSILLKVNVNKDIILELMMSIIFILSNWYAGGWLGVGAYFIAYIIYLLIKRKDIIITYIELKSLNQKININE